MYVGLPSPPTVVRHHISPESPIELPFMLSSRIYCGISSSLVFRRTNVSSGLRLAHQAFAQTQHDLVDPQPLPFDKNFTIKVAEERKPAPKIYKKKATKSTAVLPVKAAKRFKAAGKIPLRKVLLSIAKSHAKGLDTQNIPKLVVTAKQGAKNYVRLPKKSVHKSVQKSAPRVGVGFGGETFWKQDWGEDSAYTFPPHIGFSNAILRAPARFAQNRVSQIRQFS